MRNQLTFILFLLSGLLFSQTNIQWRGTDRTGVYHESGLIKEWPSDGPALKWHFDELGQGHSSVAVANDKLYVTGMKEEKGILYELDLNGKVVNKKEYGSEWFESFPGTRSTVTVNDGKIYLISSMGDLICFNQKNLDILWQKNILSTYEASNITWGINEAALVIDDIVLATPGGNKINMVAFDKNSGKQIWTSEGAGDAPAYCSPLYIADLEVPQIVSMTGSHIIGIDVKTGKTLWTFSKTNRWSIHANTPIYSDNMLLCTSGYGSGSVMLKFTDGGRNVTEVWNSSLLDNRIGGLVKVGNYVYGSGDKNRFWFCTDWETGEIKYQEPGTPGTIIANKNMLYCYTEQGELILAKTTPEKFDIVSRFKITLGTEQHWAHPVIYKGVLYIRHGETLMAYNLKE